MSSGAPYRPDAKNCLALCDSLRCVTAKIAIRGCQDRNLGEWTLSVVRRSRPIVFTSAHRANVRRKVCLGSRQDMGRSRRGLTNKIHAVVDTNGLRVHLSLAPGAAHDNRLCSVLLSALLPQTMLIADRGYDADWIRSLPASKEHGRTFRRNEIAKTDLLQPVSVSCAEPDRTALQQDQAMSACRDPARQIRSQLSGVHQARINPNLATR
jgi:transposase